MKQIKMKSATETVWYLINAKMVQKLTLHQKKTAHFNSLYAAQMW